MPPSVFISYSHKDEVWKDRLVTHLGVLEEQNLLRTWNDRNLRAGDLWLEGIESEIDGARVAVLLISANSLTSKFILHQEVPRFLELREQAGMTIFPVIVKDCAWKAVPWLSKFQLRPLDAKPLALRGIRVDSELRAIAEEILEIIAGGAPETIAVSASSSTGISLPSLHQIPAPPADFTGRQEELSALTSALTKGGVSAIFGMGGMGKSALAFRLAEELAPIYSDAQIYFDLKGSDLLLRDSKPLKAAQAMSHVVRSFHPDVQVPENEEELAGLYRSILHKKRTILLIDNARSQSQVEPLIPPPGSLLLVTSRSRFVLPGLAAKVLAELPGEKARELLLLIEPRIGSVAGEIARLCGHLPLALRFAASALAERPNLGPADYARRLKEGTLRLVPMEASLSLSYELLSEDHQRLWRLLAVFSGAFDADAAASIWEIDADHSIDILGDLARSSLVEWERKDGRYRLHDFTRSFVDRRLESKEKEAARKRHSKHYLGVLEGANALYGSGGDSALLGLRVLETEWGNIAAGQAWSVNQSKYDEDALKLCSSYPSAGYQILVLRRPTRERIRWLELAITAARALHDLEKEGYHLGNLGCAYIELGEPHRAIEFHEQALSIACNLGDRHSEGQTLGNLGLAYADLGEPHRAIEFFERDLPIAREIGDQRGEGIVLGNLGHAYSALGKTRPAIELYQQQLAIAQEIGDRHGEGAALLGLGNAFMSLDEPHRALEFYGQVLSIAREIGDRRGEAQVLGNLGLVHLVLGEARCAIDLYEQQLSLAREIGDRRGEANASWNLGLELEKTGDLVRALVLKQVLVAYEREIGHADAEKHAAEVAALRARIAAQNS